MKVLSDGSVIQSTLSNQGSTNISSITRTDVILKSGVVTDIYYTDDKNNISKEFVEYDVTVYESRHDGSVSTVTYSRCQTMDKFATPNNFEKFTLQPHKDKKDGQYLKGAKVLLLAINGNATAGKGVIIGGQSYSSESAHKEADGQTYEWQFNGINIKVDKDGQYSLTFNTFIDQDGKKADEKAAGTKLEIFKDGKMSISDNEGQSWTIDRTNQVSTWGNGAESIVIDKKNKKINIVSSGDMNETIAKAKTTTVKESDYTVETKSGSIKEKSGKDIEMEAKANIKEKAGANYTVESGGNVTIKSGGNVEIKGGGIAMIKASMVMLAAGGVPAAGVGISQCMGIGNLGAPVMSQIISGSATVLIGS